MTIREMNLLDYDSVNVLMQVLHQMHVEARPDIYGEMEHPYTKEKIMELLKDQNMIAIVAVQDSEVIGLCITGIHEPSMVVGWVTAYMDALIVDEKHRGKGIAKQLFCEAEKRAKARGAKRLDLMVWEFNESAMHFYKALSMTPQRYILEKQL